jgi:ribosomal protein S18 acetylase RimI-like enzyme
MGLKLRKANLNDVNPLIQVENACFNTDQLSERSFKYFLTKSNGYLLVAEIDKQVVGYGLILFNRGTSLARLYSIAVLKKFRKNKTAYHLLSRLEAIASEHDCTYLRLEVKQNNLAAINFYENMGYVRFAHKFDYYEDHTDAECFEKKLQKKSKRAAALKVPYYQQTTDFTCGPSSLMMAMKSLSSKCKFSQSEELNIWREATTIFMTSGHGGCGPHGLALAAFRRSFKSEIYLSSKKLLFIKGVRDQAKKDIIEIVQKEFERQIAKKPIKIFYEAFTWQKIQDILKRKGVAMVLISAYRLTQTKSPHWVVITGIEDDFIFFHDPEIDDGERAIDNMDIPVRRDEFEKMAKFGSGQLQSIVAIYKN